MSEGLSAHAIVEALRSEPDVYSEETPFRQVVLKASPEDLHRAIKECLLTPSTMSVNRRRMGVLAKALVDRLWEAVRRQHVAEKHALDAEGKLKALQDAQPATAAALKTLAKKPGVTRLEPKPKAKRPTSKKRKP